MELSIIWVLVVNRLSFGQLKAAVVDRKNVSLLILEAAIMVFEGLMTDTREGILIFLLTRFPGEDTIEAVIADDLF